VSVQARVFGGAGRYCRVWVKGRYAAFYSGAWDWHDGLRRAWREAERIRAFDAACEAQGKVASE